MMSSYDLGNMTKVEIYRNWAGELFVDTPPSQVGGANQFMRLEVMGEKGVRMPVYLNEPAQTAFAKATKQSNDREVGNES